MKAAADGLFVEVLDAYSSSSKLGIRFSLPTWQVHCSKDATIVFSVVIGAEVALHTKMCPGYLAVISAGITIVVLCNRRQKNYRDWYYTVVHMLTMSMASSHCLSLSLSPNKSVLTNYSVCILHSLRDKSVTCTHAHGVVRPHSLIAMACGDEMFGGCAGGACNRVRARH